MFIKPSSVSFVACLLAAVVCMHTSADLYLDQRSYDVKVPPVTKLADVVTYLQQLLGDRLDPNTRCDYYAIALDAFKPESRMNGEIDMFKLIDIANKNLADLREAKLRIRTNRLRLIFQGAVTELADQDQLRPAARELYDCLKNNFPGSHQDVERVVTGNEKLFDQFKSILSQPAGLLVGKQQHPDLMLEDLYDKVKKTVATWIGDGALEEVFRSGGRAPARAAHEAAAHAYAGHNNYEDGSDWNDDYQHEQVPTPEEIAIQRSNLIFKFVCDVLTEIHFSLQDMGEEISGPERCYAYNSALMIVNELGVDELTNDYIDDITDEVINSLAGTQVDRYKPTPEEIKNFEHLLQRPAPETSGDLWLYLRTCIPAKPQRARSPSNSPRRPRRQRTPSMP